MGSPCLRIHYRPLLEHGGEGLERPSLVIGGEIYFPETRISTLLKTVAISLKRPDDAAEKPLGKAVYLGFSDGLTLGVK